MNKMEEACLVCGKPLEYFTDDKEMKCMFCHKTFKSKAQCIEGHYVCDACHEVRGVEAILEYCLHCHSKNPIYIMMNIMEHPFIYMHGPEHHIMVGAALLTAYVNAGGELDLEKSLQEMRNRGEQVPGGVCGFWGSCGAGISTGIFVSILTGATPLSQREWSLANQMTAVSLDAVSKAGGPRCCKRNAFLSAIAAAEFVKENFGIEMELPEKIQCTYSKYNQQCIGKRCPFNAADR